MVGVMPAMKADSVTCERVGFDSVKKLSDAPDSAFNAAVPKEAWTGSLISEAVATTVARDRTPISCGASGTTTPSTKVGTVKPPAEPEPSYSAAPMLSPRDPTQL